MKYMLFGVNAILTFQLLQAQILDTVDAQGIHHRWSEYEEYQKRLGEYRKRLCDSIGREWNLRMERMEAHRRQLKTGMIRISFTISREGTIQNTNILSNTSNERAASAVVDSIKHANIQPPPKPPPIDAVKNDLLEQEMTFIIGPK